MLLHPNLLHPFRIDLTERIEACILLGLLELDRHILVHFLRAAVRNQDAFSVLNRHHYGDSSLRHLVVPMLLQGELLY